MKTGLTKTLLTASFAASVVLGLSTSALAQDVRVVVSGQVTPGVYGRVEVGTNPPPPVVNPRPVVITQPAPPVVVVNQPVVVATPVPAPAPVYMHVPPGHARNWRKHCQQYNACSQPVYFVRSAEYDRRGQRHGGRDGERGGEHHGGRHGHGHH